MKIYVCSPYATAREVRELHVKLRSLGWAPTSTWAEEAAKYGDAEDFSKFSADELEAIARKNDACLYDADVVVVWSRSMGGRETYAEAARAQIAGKQVYWVGAQTLSAFRPKTSRFASMDDLLELLEKFPMRPEPHHD